MVLGMYHGPLGVESLIDRAPASQATKEVLDAQR
jgi:hypothetical protein